MILPNKRAVGSPKRSATRAWAASWTVIATVTAKSQKAIESMSIF